jgi:hypothetical protein
MHDKTGCNPYDGCRKRAVQQTVPLTDQFRSTLGDICFRSGGLDTCQGPFTTSFRYQLEAKDSILGQEHVFRENIHAIYSLDTKAVGKRIVTMEVLLKGSSLNRAVPVRGEGTRQDRHVAKATLKGLI